MTQSLLTELNQSGKRALGWAAGVLGLSSLILAGTLISLPSQESSDVLGTQQASQEQTPQIDPFDTVSLQASSAFVWDVNSETVLYSKNASSSRPLASITKVMSAVTARELLPASTVVKINEQALEAHGDTGLHAQEEWMLDTLLDVSLVSSSNDAAAAIASTAGSAITNTGDFETNVELFVQAMNQKAQDIGLTKTRFFNPHGLDIDEGTSGSYGSARDVARLFEYTLSTHPTLLESTQHANLNVGTLSNRRQEVENTNTVINQIPGLLGSKTGFTDLSGGNLAVAFDAGLNRPVIAVVLGSTQEGRFDDMLQLVSATVDHVSTVKHSHLRTAQTNQSEYDQ